MWSQNRLEKFNTSLSIWQNCKGGRTRHFLLSHSTTFLHLTVISSDNVSVIGKHNVSGVLRSATDSEVGRTDTLSSNKVEFNCSVKGLMMPCHR